MQKYFHILILLSLLFCGGCHFSETEKSFDPEKNFNALWTIVDENYCFFEYKNIDWNAVYDRYRVRLSSEMSSRELFYLMAEMLSELKDGHVNLIAKHDMSRYWSWHEDFPDNFDSKIIDNYLGTDYGIACGMRYKILDDNIGYIYYSDFSKPVTDSSLDQILMQMSICRGLIFDVRDNGGGLLTNIDKIMGRFINTRVLIGYICHKSGPGHSDFSSLRPRYIDSSNRIRYQKSVVVLTNRSCYSATNEFVSAMKQSPLVTVMGDRTGGGSGLPFSSELPNGWSVRFSSSPLYNVDKEQIEFGVEPDIHVEMRQEDMSKGIDTIIEAARRFLALNN